MNRLAFTLIVLGACGPSLPRPRSPLTMTPAASQPARPGERSVVHAPRFPQVDVSRLPGTNLWLLQRPGTGVATIRILTRRGNDGAYADESMRSMLSTLQLMLEERLLGYRVGAHLDADTASLSFTVRSADAPQTFAAISAVLDGPVDGAIARRAMRVNYIHRPGTVDYVRRYLYEGPIEPPIIHSASLLAECRNERFASTDRLITVVGEFDKREVLSAATAAFASAQDHSRIPPMALRTKRPEEGVLRGLSSRRFEAGLAIGMPGRTHEDRDALDVVFFLFADQLNIMDSEHAGVLAPAVEARLGEDVPARVAIFRVNGTDQNAAPLFTALFRHAREFIAGPFDADEVERARAFFWRSTQQHVDSNPTAVLTEAFARNATPNELETRYQALGTLTPDELLIVARRYLSPERMLPFVRAPTRLRLHVVRDAAGFRLVETAP